MASFVSELVNFNPYIAQTPVDDYVRVGMIKQDQYNQGVQRVQGFIDSISGFDIAKDVSRDYLKSRITQLQSEVGKVISSADFSNNQLVNQIGGLSNQIASDPIIQNAIKSTATIRSNQAQLEADRKAGKLTPDNEWYFTDQVNKWMSDKDVKSSFNGGYVPNVDVLAEFMKVFKETHQSSKLTQDAFRIDDNGNIALNPALEQTSFEGITPAQVKEVADLVFSKPEIRQQLEITGKYKYRGLTPDKLYEGLKETYEQTIKDINDQAKELKLQLAHDKTANNSIISQKILQLKEIGGQRVKEYQAYIKQLNTDPEAVKASLHESSLKSSLMNSFSWSKTSQEIKDNPLWKAKMDELKYELDVSKFAFDQEEAKWKKQLEFEKLDISREEFRMKQEKQAKEDKEAAGTNIVTLKNTPETAGGQGSASFFEDHTATMREFNDKSYTYVNMIANSTSGNERTPPPYKKDAQNRWIPNVGEGGYKNAAEAHAAYKKIYSAARMSYADGKPLPIVTTMFDELDPIIRKLDYQNYKKAEIEKPAFAIVERARKEAGQQNTDLFDYWMVNTKTAGWQDAEKRLKNKYKDNYSNFVSDITGTIRQGGGMGASYTKGVRAAEYEKVRKVIEANPTLMGAIKDREQAYKDAQMAYQTYQVDISTPKNETRNAVNQRYISILSELNKGPNSSKIEDMLEVMKNDKDNKIENNTYGYYKDRNSGKSYLTLKRPGEETMEVEVPGDVIPTIPGANITDPFWTTHGPMLSITGNTTTDIRGSGNIKGLPMKRDPRSEFTTRYHLTGDGNGRYEIKLAIWDSGGKLIADDVKFPAPNLLDGDQVMSALQALKNDSVIKGILQK